MSDSAQRPDRPELPKLPAGAAGILPTVWVTFVVTVLLALAFSFANVWELGRTLGIEKHVAPLIGPAVDLTAVGLLVVVPWLVLAGVPTSRLGAANKLMAAAGFLTLALNSAPSAIKGWTAGDARAWGRAAVEAIVPFLLMAWSHVGPKLVAIFVEVREAHARRVEEILRAAENASVESAKQRATEVAEAIEEALRESSVEWETRLAEVRQQASTELKDALAEAAARHAEQFAEVRENDACRLRELEEARAAEQRLRAELEASTKEIERLREKARGASTRPPRKSSTKPPEASERAPRKSAEELLEERVEAAKEALPTWQLETPSGPEIASALGLKSDGVISAVRKQLEADRSALPTSTPKGA